MRHSTRHHFSFLSLSAARTAAALLCLATLAWAALPPFPACARDTPQDPPVMDWASFAALVSPEPVLAYLPLDYDNDGRTEAFAVTGSVSYDEYGMRFCSDISVYAISAANEVVRLRKDLFGYYPHALHFIYTVNSVLLEWYRNDCGPVGVSYLFGFRDGAAYEPAISGRCDGITRKGTRFYKTTRHRYTEKKGHQFLSCVLKYDETTGEFELVSVREE